MLRRALSAVALLFTVAAAVITAACGDGEEATPTPFASPPAAASPTSPAGQTPAASPTPPRRVAVQVFFLDQENFNAGDEPFVTAVSREVDPPAVARGALEDLFAGTTEDEQAQGLRFVASGATGFTDFVVSEDGIARLQLVGGCDSGGSTFTVAQEIIPTLTQFPSIQHVKIYGPQGDTEQPEGDSNSIPVCLEP